MVAYQPRWGAAVMREGCSALIVISCMSPRVLHSDHLWVGCWVQHEAYLRNRDGCTYCEVQLKDIDLLLPCQRKPCGLLSARSPHHESWAALLSKLDRCPLGKHVSAGTTYQGVRLEASHSRELHIVQHHTHQQKASTYMLSARRLLSASTQPD